MLSSFPIVMSPISRNWRADRSPVERMKDEQAFYERFSGDAPRFDWAARIGAAVIAAELVLAVGGFVLGWH